MKTLEIDYTMMLDFSVPATNHYFVLRCVPVSRGCQTVTARKLEITPDTSVLTSRDVFGNVSYRGLIKEPHSKFGFRATATVQVNSENGSRENCLLLYKYSTSLTYASDAMKRFLYKTFEGTDMEESVRTASVPRENVRRFASKLMDAVNHVLVYEPGVTSVSTSAREAFELGKGVCQDYAHIFCSLSRIAGVPARYVCGTSEGEGSTHAWVEVFMPDPVIHTKRAIQIPGRWYGYDPTRNKLCDDDYVILAVGRDYNDCQVDRGILCGGADQTQTVFVKTINEQ